MLNFQDLISQEYDDYIEQMRDSCHFPILWVDSFYKFKDLLEKIPSDRYNHIGVLISQSGLSEFDYKTLNSICNAIEATYIS